MDKNIKLTIQYDGTDYSGWQVQPNSTTIQGEIEKALFTVTKEKIMLNGSGRTDAGVHALAQTANFHTGVRMPASRFKHALNAVLPEDIVIISSEEAEATFNARFSAVGKHYRYGMYASDTPLVLGRQYYWQVHRERQLNVEKMHRAVKHFIGTHDFKGFMSTGSYVTDTVRTIHSAYIDVSGPYIDINVIGNGFLYNMVRIIAGTILYCGIGKLLPEDIPQIINSGKRENAGVTAPAKGLKLIEVYY